MRHFLSVADVGDVIHDVVSVLLEGVVGGADESRAAAVVIHAQPAADVQKFDLEPHLEQLGVKSRRFLDGFFDDQNVGHLRADVEMQQFETVPQILGPEQFHGGQDLSGAQAELGIFSAALGPAARAFAQEPRANADHRFDPQLFREVDNLAKFLEFLHHHDDFFAQLGAQQRDANEAGIFVAVANDQAAQLALQRQAREQFGLAADLQSEVERLAGIQDFFDDFPELV